MVNKKRGKKILSKYVKQTSLASILILLIWTAVQLFSHFLSSAPTKIPGAHSTIEIYSNQMQDNLTQLYQQAIEKAEKSITLIIYALTDETIIYALQKKCDAGIPIHIICEAKASKGISRRLPKATIVKRYNKGFMHQKILIVDNHLVWLGSANLTHSSLNIHGNLVIGMNHPSLAQALSIRAKSMNEEGDTSPLLHQETTAGSQQLELWVLPDDPGASKRIIHLIRSAKKCIKIAMYTWTRKDFTEELLTAAKRGVKVEAVIDRTAGNGSGAKVVKMLEKGGIPVTLSTSQGLLHHKFAYIDETVLVNGSANWTKAAFNENDDCFLIIYPLTSDQQVKMNKLYEIIQKQSKNPNFVFNTPRSKFDD